MIHEAEQFEIPFEGVILHHVPEYIFDPEKEEAKRTEFYAMCWMLGHENPDLWRSIPNYERQRVILMYQFEEEMQTRTGRPLKRTYAEAQAEVDGWYNKNRETAEYMAETIREDFKHRRPCSYIMQPQYQWLLDWAFELAQVPRESLPQSAKHNLKTA